MTRWPAKNKLIKSKVTKLKSILKILIIQQEKKIRKKLDNKLKNKKKTKFFLSFSEKKVS